MNDFREWIRYVGSIGDEVAEAVMPWLAIVAASAFVGVALVSLKFLWKIS